MGVVTKGKEDVMFEFGNTVSANLRVDPAAVFTVDLTGKRIKAAVGTDGSDGILDSGGVDRIEKGQQVLIR